MPIYRGSQKVTPRPGGQSAARVYRGDRLVWQAGQSLALDWVLPPTTISGYSYTRPVLFTEPEGPGSIYEIISSLEHSNPKTSQSIRHEFRTLGGGVSTTPTFDVYSQVSGQVYTAQITLEPGFQVSHSASINGPGDDVITGWVTMRRLGDPT